MLTGFTAVAGLWFVLGTVAALAGVLPLPAMLDPEARERASTSGERSEGAPRASDEARSANATTGDESPGRAGSRRIGSRRIESNQASAGRASPPGVSTNASDGARSAGDEAAEGDTADPRASAAAGDAPPGGAATGSTGSGSTGSTADESAASGSTASGSAAGRSTEAGSSHQVGVGGENPEDDLHLADTPQSDGVLAPGHGPRRSRVGRSWSVGPKLDLESASLAVGQISGDERPELVVGAGNRFEVLTPLGEHRYGHLLTIQMRTGDVSLLSHTPRAGIGDITGDGNADIVLPFFRTSERGGSRGGGAFLVRGFGEGRFGAPRRFTPNPTMATSVLLTELNGRRGLDILVGDRGRPFGTQEGVVRVYFGGGHPRIAATLSEVLGVDAIALGHIDDDDALDVVACGNEVRVFYGKGGARFVRGAPVPSENDDCEAASGDLDGDGRVEVLVSQPRTRVIRHDEDARPLGTRQVFDVADVDGDGRADLAGVREVGMDQEVVVSYATGRTEAVLSVEDDWIHDARLVDLDGDGQRDLAAVVGSAHVVVLVAWNAVPPDQVLSGEVETLPGAAEYDVR